MVYHHSPWTHPHNLPGIHIEVNARLPSSVVHCMESVICSLSLFCGLRSAVCGLRSAVCGLRSAVCGLRSAVCGLRSAVCGLRSAVCGLRSAVCGLRSAVCGLRSANIRHRAERDWALMNYCNGDLHLSCCPSCCRWFRKVSQSIRMLFHVKRNEELIPQKFIVGLKRKN